MVSVVMPLYNAEKFVQLSIESILSQTFRDFELIIVDDCSTDDSYSIAKTYALCDSRIRLLRNVKNLGVSKSLNNGILAARHEFIAIMHADDISCPERLQIQKDYLSNNPAVTVVGAACDVIDESGNYLSKVAPSTLYEDILVYILRKNNPFAHPTAMLRKTAVYDIGFYDTNVDGLEDLDLWMRLAASGYRIAAIKDSLLKYRTHSNQISQNYTERDYGKNIIITKKFLNIIMRGSVHESSIINRYTHVCVQNFRTVSFKDFYFGVLFFHHILSHSSFISEAQKNPVKKAFMRFIFRTLSKRKPANWIRFSVAWLAHLNLLKLQNNLRTATLVR